MPEITKPRSKRTTPSKAKKHSSELVEVYSAERFAESKVHDSETTITDVVENNVLEVGEAMKMVYEADQEITESVAKFEEIVADAVVKISQISGEISDVEIEIDDTIIAAEQAIVEAISSAANSAQSDSYLSYTKSLNAVKNAERIITEE